MTPVRVKLYGLIPMTRRRYLVQLVVALVMSAGLLVGWWLYWPTVRGTLEASRSDVLDRVIWFWDRAPWVIGGIVVVQTIEAWVVLKRFRQIGRG